MRLLHEALPKLSLLKILTTPDPPELKGLSQAAAESGSAAYEQLKQRDKLRALKAHLSQVAEPVVEVMLHQRDRCERTQTWAGLRAAVCARASGR